MNTWGLKWKGAVLGAAALAALAGPARVAGAAVCGDLNGDGNRTIADAVRLQRALFVPNAADCGGAGSASCGDVNPSSAGLGVDDAVVLEASLNNKPTLFSLCTGEGTTPCAANAGSGPGGESWTTRTTRSGTISANEHWIAGCRVDIDGLTFVASGVTITIDPGALIVGRNPPSPGNGGPTNVSALIFLRGSKINAVANPAAPVVMTSSSHVDANNGAPGDWGGLTLNGAAPVNCPSGECLAEGLVGVPFGGTNPGDSSGQVEYLRVEFSGRELTPDNELNVITLNGVGSGTIWDHSQANIGFDDCHEWFGGTMNAKFVVSSGCGDDLHDTQLGTTGKFQYYLGVYYNPVMQNAGNHGFEWDNNENGFDLLPRNAPKVCNATMVGSPAPDQHGRREPGARLEPPSRDGRDHHEHHHRALPERRPAGERQRHGGAGLPAGLGSHGRAQPAVRQRQRQRWPGAGVGQLDHSMHPGGVVRRPDGRQSDESVAERQRSADAHRLRHGRADRADGPEPVHPAGRLARRGEPAAGEHAGDGLQDHRSVLRHHQLRRRLPARRPGGELAHLAVDQLPPEVSD